MRFARMKHERQSRLQVVVQMVAMAGNAGRGGRLHGLLELHSGYRPGAHQAGTRPTSSGLLDMPRKIGSIPCHYLWRGPVYVKQSGDVYPCCQSYMLDGAPLANIAEKPLLEIWNTPPCRR
ncbi:MAG: SPASM domain-containing protein [Ignavibacteriota bacterium]